MEFIVTSRGPKLFDNNKSVVHLEIDNWNDFSFVMMFHMSFYDHNGDCHNIGTTKIAFKGQTTAVSTFEKLDKKFTALGDEFFPWGKMLISTLERQS